MGLSNDERGWILSLLSGAACVIGSSIICVDLLVRQFPGKRHFRIQESDAFLSLSLSLSSGVMLFSSLYSIMPSARNSLEQGGLSSKAAAWTLVACFVGGIFGIQLISGVIHSHMPSKIVDCEHSHDGDAHSHEAHNQTPNLSSEHGQTAKGKTATESQTHQQIGYSHPSKRPNTEDHTDSNQTRRMKPDRPPFRQRLTNRITHLMNSEGSSCDCVGSCYGYSDICGQKCFTNSIAEGSRTGSEISVSMSKESTARLVISTNESTPLLGNTEREMVPESSNGRSSSSSSTLQHNENPEAGHGTDIHHHHVPTNAFLSVGLQTAIAIALHKLPEGFITYASNHANPELGLSVFLALFVHNITEGFAMTLPLYLAINSRLKAMLVSFVLGGLSQPAGAAVAALWFHLAGREREPSEAVYGGMFAVTAGILTSVALQLFRQSVDHTHSKRLCMIGAFTGMTILGISSALTA